MFGPGGGSRLRRRHARLGAVYVVHGTRKFLERVGAPSRAEVGESTTVLGDWYATVLFWKPQAGLFVNESTLLPVLLPFAPAATTVGRFPAALATVLRRHGIDEAFIEAEREAMDNHRLAKTKDRSVVGMMTEFAFLSRAYAKSEDAVDLVELSLWLARTPCGPLASRQGSPDRELAAHIARRRG
jgi:hypothetical protein